MIMRKKFKELTDEAAYAIENGEAIDWDIFESAYEDQCMDYFRQQRWGLMECIGYLEYSIDRFEKTEENLRTVETQIIGLIGKKSYDDIMDLLDMEKKRLREDIAKSLASYHDLNRHINKTDNNIKNKVK
jgi:hypothetical protein